MIYKYLQIPQPDIDIPADSVIINRFTASWDRFAHMSWPERGEFLLSEVISLGLRIGLAILIFIVGRWLIKKIDKLIDKIFTARKIDTSLNTFVRNMLRIVAYIILIMIIIYVLGIRTTSFVAILASASFAIGMALSGTLQNFAGGILILLLKPFRTGDYVTAQGVEGTVKEIRLFNTVLITPDNKMIVVPNGGMSTTVINNASATGTRRVEWMFGISYGDNYDEAKDILKQLLDEDTRIMAKPPYFIALQSLDESAVTIVVRAWTTSGDFWDVFYDMNEKVYKLFPEKGLSIPYNQLDVNLSMRNEQDSEPKPKASRSEIRRKLKDIGNDTKSDDNSITCTDLGLKPGGGEVGDEEDGDPPGATVALPATPQTATSLGATNSVGGGSGNNASETSPDGANNQNIGKSSNV